MRKSTNKNDLWEKIQEIWYNIEVDVDKKLICLMPQRALDVYQTKVATSSGSYCECLIPKGPQGPKQAFGVF